jgi:hypothetical protein
VTTTTTNTEGRQATLAGLRGEVAERLDSLAWMAGWAGGQDERMAGVLGGATAALRGVIGRIDELLEAREGPEAEAHR